MRKAAGCVLLAILCLLGASYLPRILQEAQTDREQQNLISGYIQNPDTTDEENTESTTDEPEEETDPNMERIVDFQNLQQINPEILAWITVPGTPIDYPVALGEDNSYYLNHTVTGESNILGSIFATAGTDFEESTMIRTSGTLILMYMFIHRKLLIPVRYTAYTTPGMTVMFLHWDIKVTARNGNNGLQKPYRMRNMTVILPRPERRKFLLYPPA